MEGGHDKKILFLAKPIGKPSNVLHRQILVSTLILLDVSRQLKSFALSRPIEITTLRIGAERNIFCKKYSFYIPFFENEMKKNFF